MRFRTLAILAACAAVAAPAYAQLTTVPMKGVGNEWVKKLDLKGRMDWEWIETYPEQVYFATRHDSERNGDIVTMWTRLEYKHPHHPLAHKSSVSRDDWDCTKRQRSTRGLVFYKWNNLQDESPERSTNLLRYWEKIEQGTIGETLLLFACSIKPVQPLIQPEPAAKP
jgi:surface-adhesin protein E